MKNLIQAFLSNKKITIPVTIAVVALVIGGVILKKRFMKKEIKILGAEKSSSYRFKPYQPDFSLCAVYKPNSKLILTDPDKKGFYLDHIKEMGYEIKR